MNLFKKTLFLSAFLSTPLQAQTTILLDANSPGRVFEGIGAVSAGASTRNLVDFPQKQRDEVLDLLFKPGFGASLQHLKVEVGGDDNSTCGSEPSHVRSRAELADPKARGYEFWLMAEARKRNPALQLDCLPWCYPAWISDRFSQDSADWIVAFLDVARHNFGLELDWLAAGQNEKGTDMDWVANILRPTLDKRGYGNVKLQGPDDVRDKWKIFEQLAKNPEYNSALKAVGYHYPSHWLPKVEDEATPVPEEVKAIGKPLWSSEEFSLGGNTWDNALLWAQLINKLYICDRITKIEAWCPVDAINPGILFAGTGLMQARESWSGHYQVWPAIWTTAHFTQFAKPGWRFLDSGCGRFDPKTWTGSHVALVDPDTKDWSLIACTAVAEPIRVELSPELKRGPVHVWKSTADGQFVQLPDIAIADGTFELNLEKNAVYSITNTDGQSKGGFPDIPASKPFPAPYREDFESYQPGMSPRYLSDQKGTFETVARPGGGRCLQQMAPKEGIIWTKVRTPYTAWGDSRWRDYTVKTDVLIQGGSVEVGGRYFAEQSEDLRSSLATHLVLHRSGDWELLTHQVKDEGINKFGLRVIKTHPQSLAKGRIEGFDPDRWHTVRMTFLGSQVTAGVDGTVLASGQAEGPPTGLAYLATSFDPNCFDNLGVTVADMAARP